MSRRNKRVAGKWREGGKEDKWRKRSREIGWSKENILSFYIISLFALLKKYYFTKIVFYLVTFFYNRAYIYERQNCFLIFHTYRNIQEVKANILIVKNPTQIKNCKLCILWRSTQNLKKLSLLSKFRMFLQYMQKCNFIYAPYICVAFPPADVYETHRISTVPRLDYIHRISPKPGNKCGKYRAIFIYALK